MFLEFDSLHFNFTLGRMLKIGNSSSAEYKNFPCFYILQPYGNLSSKEISDHVAQNDKSKASRLNL